MKNYIVVGLFGIYFSALFLFGPLWVTDSRVGWGWVLLAALSLLLTAAAAYFKQQFRFPSKNITVCLLGFLALAAAFSLLNGATLLEERWTHRWATLLLFVGLIQWFENPKELGNAIRYPVLFFILALGLEAVYQNFFVCPTSNLGTSCFSSRLYNINMLTQTLLMGIVLLEYLRLGATKKMRWVFHAAVFLSLAVIVYSQSRSAWLAISLFTLSRLFFSRKEFLRFLLPLLLLAVVFKLDPRDTPGIKTVEKQYSTGYRWELAVGSLKMMAEHPFGVGVNNFEFGFIPYRNESPLAPTVELVDKTPHNDFLLVFTEEGWIVGAAFLLLVAFLSWRALKLLRVGSRALWPSFLVIMILEILIQFPMDMHFFAFALAVVLAEEVLAGAVTVRVFNTFARTAFFVLAVMLTSAGIIRYNTFTNAEFSPLYCTVFHDAWKNCGFYFNRHLKRGDIARAEKTLRPVIKYQKFNYVMHHWDYLLYNPERNPVIACNYTSLFKNEISIPTSDTSRCEKNLSRQEITKRIENYSRTR